MKAGGKASAPAIPLAQPSLIHYETQNSLATTVRFSLHSWVEHYEKHTYLAQGNNSNSNNDQKSTRLIMELLSTAHVYTHTHVHILCINKQQQPSNTIMFTQASTPQKYCWGLDYQFEGRLHMPHGQQQYRISRYCQVPIVQLEQWE